MSDTRRNNWAGRDRQSITPSAVRRALRQYDRAIRRSAMQRRDYDTASANTSRAYRIAYNVNVVNY